MNHEIELALLLVSLMIAISWMANLLKLPGPLVLVPAGIAIGFIPVFPPILLNPDLALYAFLPILVYAGGYTSSWNDVKKNLRPITQLSVGLVVVTTLVLGWVAHTFIPGFSWPVALIFGAIISPPDDVAVMAIATKMGLPHKLLAILQGEGLFNDAAALTLFRVFLFAAAARSISLGSALGTFGLMVILESVYGYLLGTIASMLRRKLKDNQLDLTFSLLIPYLAYLPAVKLGGSGVLATVVAGLYVGRNNPKYSSFSARLNGLPVWEFLVFLFNSSLFFLTGLQFKHLIGRLPEFSAIDLVKYAVLVNVAVIAIRFLWVFPGAYIPRLLSHRVRERNPEFTWKRTFIVAWSGMRGAISLAAALAIPVSLASGAAFPQRDLIIFLTFSVIITTLVLQGTCLSPLIKLLGLRGEWKDEVRNLKTVRTQAALLSITAALEQIELWRKLKRFPEKLLTELRADHENLRFQLQEKLKTTIDAPTSSKLNSLTKPLNKDRISDRLEAQLELILTRRKTLIELRNQGKIGDKTLRSIERDLDISEMQIQG